GRSSRRSAGRGRSLRAASALPTRERCLSPSSRPQRVPCSRRAVAKATPAGDARRVAPDTDGQHRGGVMTGLTVVVGSDDAGFELKQQLAAQLREDPRVAEVIDVGVHEAEARDYPHVAVEAARIVAAGDADRA